MSDGETYAQKKFGPAKNRPQSTTSSQEGDIIKRIKDEDEAYD
jgi:hypothetical protein